MIHINKHIDVQSIGLVEKTIMVISPFISATLSVASTPHFSAPAWAYLPLYIAYTLGGWVFIITGIIAYRLSLSIKIAMQITCIQSAVASISYTLLTPGRTSLNDFLSMLAPLMLLHACIVIPFATAAKLKNPNREK